MDQPVMHPDTRFLTIADVDPPTSVPVQSVAAGADRITELAGAARGLTVELARLVREGTGTDGAPVEAAKQLMAAARDLVHAGTGLSVLGLGHLDVTQAHHDDAMRTPAAWTELHCGDTRAELILLGRLRRCVVRYPLIAEAFLSGRLRAGQLTSIDKIIPRHYAGAILDEAIEWVRAVQSEILQGAELCLTDRDFHRFCAQIRHRLDSDGPPPEDRPAVPSEMWLKQRADQRWELSGTFAAEIGALLATMIETEDRRQILADQAAAAEAKQASDAARTARTASGEQELASEPTDPDGPVERKSAAQRHAEALFRLIMNGAGATKPGRVGVYLHIELDDLRIDAGADGVPAMAHTEANHDITIDSLWNLLADADITPIYAQTGTPLCFGRTRRLAPSILRRVLAHRDRRCGFPGCESPPPWHRAHHTLHWDDGGNTCPLECKGTCGYHHGRHHDHGWKLDNAPNGRAGDYTVTRPDGRTHDPTPRWLHQQPADPYRALTLHRLHQLTREETAA